MNFNMKNTPPDAGLCATCRFAHIVTPQATQQQAVFCEWSARSALIPGGAAECNNYRDQNAMTRDEARQIGWTLDVSETGKIGFSPPKNKDRPDI